MSTRDLSKMPGLVQVGNFDLATSLTEDLPQGVDADILLLGCGDARHILYTLFAENGLPSRKFDFTACDTDEGTLGKNSLHVVKLGSTNTPQRATSCSSHSLWTTTTGSR